MPRLFWFLFTPMLATWIAMNFVTVPEITRLSGGLRLLDMRLCGYSFAEAQDFVAAIGDDGAALYLRLQFRLDMIFPPLHGSVLFFCYRWLFPGRPGLLIGTLSLVYVVVDYLENFSVVTMLRAGASAITPEMAATASQWTVMKWSIALVGLVTLLIGTIVRFIRRQ